MEDMALALRSFIQINLFFKVPAQNTESRQLFFVFKQYFLTRLLLQEHKLLIERAYAVHTLIFLKDKITVAEKKENSNNKHKKKNNYEKRFDWQIKDRTE